MGAEVVAQPVPVPFPGLSWSSRAASLSWELLPPQTVLPVLTLVFPVSKYLIPPTIQEGVFRANKKGVLYVANAFIYFLNLLIVFSPITI